MKRCDKEILDKVYTLAFKYDAAFGSCPQAVLRAIYEVFNLKNMDMVIKASHALAGGLGLSGNGSCGALAGGSFGIKFCAW